MKIFYDIRQLFYRLMNNGKTAAQIAAIFDHERKWVYKTLYSESFVVNYKTIAGFDSLGYELVLRKKDKK